MLAEPPPARLDELPPALTDHIGFLGVVLGQRSQQLFERALAPLDVRPVQFDYLACLASTGPLPQRALADLMEVDAARIVALTDELEAQGCVTRTVDHVDRRRKLLTLTANGKALFLAAQEAAKQVQDTLLTHLDEAQRKQLRALLRLALGMRD